MQQAENDTTLDWPVVGFKSLHHQVYSPLGGFALSVAVAVGVGCLLELAYDSSRSPPLVGC